MIHSLFILKSWKCWVMFYAFMKYKMSWRWSPLLCCYQQCLSGPGFYRWNWPDPAQNYSLISPKSVSTLLWLLLSTFQSLFGRALSKYTYTWVDEMEKIRLYWFKVVIFSTIYKKLLILKHKVVHDKQQAGQMDLITIYPEMMYWGKTTQEWP